MFDVVIAGLPTGPPLALVVSNMHFCDLFFYHKSLDDATDALKDIDDFKWRYVLVRAHT
jgi:hypothetical protein